MNPRILIAGLFHETHTFLKERTGLDAFEKRSGDRTLACRGDASPLGGALATAAELGWHVIPGPDWRATPSGLVERSVPELFWTALRPHLDERLDGVFLILHGAMVSEDLTDVEGDLLARIRSLKGAELPLFGVFDLHANFSHRMAQLANGLVAYRENPHADARDSAVRAVRLMDAAVRNGTRLHMARCRVPVIWPPSGTGTGDDPMRTLEEMARRAEATGEVKSVSVCAGYAYADTPDTGVCIVAVANELDAALKTAQEISLRAFELRELGNASDLAKADVQRIVIAHCEQNSGTLVIAEQSDNIGGGAPGDGTGLLNWFLEWNVPDALLAINDPATVQAAEALGAGQTGSFCVGGKECDLGGAPVCGDFEVLRTGDGLFVLEDPNSHLASMCGNRFDMGRCAVLKRAGTTILVTSRKTPPFDLGQWRSQGIEPGDFRVIGVKAAVAHQRAYTPIAKALIWADTPGPCSGNVATLPYRLVERPIYPLDKTANFFVP